MRIINLVDGIDINYEHFSLITRTTPEELFEIVAYSNFNSNIATLCTVEKYEEAETILKNIALAYGNGVKAYYIKS